MAKQKDEPTPAAPAPPVSIATQLRNLLTKATAEDVKEIDDEITKREDELEKLRANRKMLAQAVGLEEPKKVHWTKRKKAEAPPHSAKGAAAAAGDAPPPVSGWDADLTPRRKIALKHLRAVGPCSMDNLSAATRISRQGPGNLAAVVKHDWFHLSPENMVSLTSAGDRVQL